MIFNKKLSGVFVFLVLFGLIAAGIAYKLTSDPALTQPHVVFIVMDMVRSDRLSMCGHNRPTSPVFDALAKKPGVQATCNAYSPGTWTLPSHASYFTGEEVPIHGADCILKPDGVDSVSLWGDPVRPLTGNIPTLAQRMRDRGYRTVMVSGNPVVSRWAATGLDRGFQVLRESRQFGDLYGKDLLAALKSALGEVPVDAPLFLFINIADVHHPWLPVPKNLEWVPPRPFLDNRPRISDNPYPRFFRGEMTDEERVSFLAHANDSYDYAVWRADNTLGRVLEILEKRGITKRPHRLIVTSDHGEFLGEHDLLSHGIFVYEPDTRVPLVFTSSSPSSSFKTSGPMAALASYDLALDGALRDIPRPVRAAGYPDGLLSRLFGDKLKATTAAQWNGDKKLFYINGEYSIFDLKADPDELDPHPLPDSHPLKKHFEGFVKQIMETSLRKTEPSKEMIEALRALGYVE